jgi:DNA-binding helix-hairpin-helix protein with protein kinase domain
VKIYHEPPDEDQQRRLVSMMRMSPLAQRSTDGRQPAELAWPIALAANAAKKTVGYSMGRFGPPDHVPLNALFGRRLRSDFFTAELDWRFLLGVAWNLAYMTARLHIEGIVVGDYSARNVVVSQNGFVTFLDCDSMAFTDPGTGETFQSSMHTPEYTAPERYTGAGVSVASDNFALAVLIFQLLTGGNHPFGGVPRDSDPSTSISMRSRISSGSSYVLHPDSIVVPKGTVQVDVLPPAVVELARRTFGPAITDPTVRPTSAEWFHALEAERSRVRSCGARLHHTYASHLDFCPWCARTERNEADLFDSAPAGLRPARAPGTAPTPDTAGTAGTHTVAGGVPAPDAAGAARGGGLGFVGWSVVVVVLIVLLVVLGG